MMRSLLAALVSVVILLSTPIAGAPVASPFGDYPNCIAPSVPLEQHGWWQESTDATARHIHIGACMPNARDLTGALVSVTGVQPFVVRIVTFNNPDPITSVRWSWESSVKQTVSGSWGCPGTATDHNECMWYVPMLLNTTSAKNGLRELRLTENISNNAFGNRHFGTLNPQVYVKNGTATGSNYRKVTDPIARSWYDGFDYANVQVNYMSLFAGGVGGAQLDRSVPLVSGVVPLKIKHAETNNLAGSELWIDADFHHYPNDWTDAVEGIAQPSGATLLYRRAGRFAGTYNLDTRNWPNGRHALYFQTTDRDETGIHASALKVFIDVQN